MSMDGRLTSLVGKDKSRHDRNLVNDSLSRLTVENDQSGVYTVGVQSKLTKSNNRVLNDQLSQYRKWEKAEISKNSM